MQTTFGFYRGFYSLIGLFALVMVPLYACKAKRNDSIVKVNSTDPANPAVDMNDLSYMFPKNKAREIYPMIKVARGWGNSRLPILSPHVYKGVVLATEDQANFTPKNKSTSFKGIKTPFIDSHKDRYRHFEYNRLVVTAFRIDPCAPSLTLDPNRTNYQGPSPYWPGAGNGRAFAQNAVAAMNAETARLGLPFQLKKCQTQIRLIVQPTDGNGRLIKESTIHLVYTINGPGSKYALPSGVMHPELTQAVIDLKRDLQAATEIDTTGLMLQEHPGLKYEAMHNTNAGEPGKGAQVIMDFLSTYLGDYAAPQVMAIIREERGEVPTRDGGTTKGTISVILGGGAASGSYQPSALVGSSPSNGFIMTSSSKRGSWRIVPAPEINPLINAGIFNDGDLGNVSHSENEILSRLMTADNPETSHFFSNDCISCHGSSQLLREMVDKSTAQNNSKRYRIPAGVSGFPIGSYLPGSPSEEGKVMLRNFGYSQNRPIIGLRTVSETASLVDYFNRDLRGVRSPGADCTTPQGGSLESLIWTRTMNLGLRREFRGAEHYRLDLEKLRSTRSAPEDHLFSGCDPVNRTPVGKRGDSSSSGDDTTGGTNSDLSATPVGPLAKGASSTTSTTGGSGDGRVDRHNEKMRRIMNRVATGSLIVKLSGDLVIKDASSGKRGLQNGTYDIYIVDLYPRGEHTVDDIENYILIFSRKTGLLTMMRAGKLQARPNPTRWPLAYRGTAPTKMPDSTVEDVEYVVGVNFPKDASASLFANGKIERHFFMDDRLVAWLGKVNQLFPPKFATGLPGTN